jgi:predicted nuclease with TOPRIM domain
LYYQQKQRDNRITDGQDERLIGEQTSLQSHCARLESKKQHLLDDSARFQAVKIEFNQLKDENKKLKHDKAWLESKIDSSNSEIRDAKMKISNLEISCDRIADDAKQAVDEAKQRHKNLEESVESAAVLNDGLCKESLETAKQSLATVKRKDAENRKFIENN